MSTICSKLPGTKTNSGMNFRNILTLSVALAVSLTSVPLRAQEDAFIRSVVFLSGASSEEELDEAETERYMHYLSHPLEINLASRSRLLSSGLLSRFQVASIEDYRSRNGDILSFYELATLAGFGEGYAEALRPFLSLRSRSMPGVPAGDTVSIRQDAVSRIAVRGGEFNYGFKYKLSQGKSFETSFAVRSYYGDGMRFPPSKVSFSTVLFGRNRMEKLVIGDFNARFGQGLALWSGMSLTGFSNTASFCRRPNGLSPTWSYAGSGSHRGEAAEFRFGRFLLSQFISFPGLRSRTEGVKREVISVIPGANLTWLGRDGQVGLTGYHASGYRLSADFRFNRKGIDLFGEYAYDFKGGSAAWIFGTSVPLGGDVRFNAVSRSYPAGYASGYSGGVRAWSGSSGERGLSFGLERLSSCLTFDFAEKIAKERQRQCKIFLKLPLQFADNYVLTIRFTERLRPDEPYLKYRTGARLDLDWSSAGLSSRYGSPEVPAWKARVRTEGILCRSLGWLSYFEGGRVTDRFSAYLRGTVFIVDNWDDRIYSYERDAPGNFTVPSYYGRGWSLGAYAGAKFGLGKKKYKALKLYFRASTVRYPFMDEPKPARTEVKFQAVVSL